ncbi:MAG: hypothetical protein ABSC13_01655 [Dehalococcoidia bacterium]|jgi:hypothetical protein
MRSAALLFLGLILAIGAVACGGSGNSASTPTPATATAVATPASALGPTPETDTLPSRDMLDLAVRLKGVQTPPADPVSPLPQSLSVGDKHTFNLVLMPQPGAAGDQPPVVQLVSATLQLVTPHAYFYVQDGQSVSSDDINTAGERFENEVYPVVTSTFGTERSPGIDNDTHITVFNGQLEGAAGYFSDIDEYPKALAPISNEREMLYLDLSLGMGSDAYTSVIAHELQHLIHFNGNPREDVWINEGNSVVSGDLAGQSDDFRGSFLKQPDTQLTVWNLNGDNYAHYGAAGLFFRYLALRSGGASTLHDIVFETGKGISGIEDFLQKHNEPSFVDLFADWTVANYTGGPQGYLAADQRVATTTTLNGPKSADTTVHQFAANYIEVDLPGQSGTFGFAGAQTVPLVSNAAHSGSGQWWSGRGDDIDTTLTRELDLTSVNKATLNFWTWFDIEHWYDFGYVEVSTDDGATWKALSGKQTSNDDPVKQAYGPAYSGESGGGQSPQWVQESIDLSQFAGKKVLLRFEYVTDGGVSGEGWAIDDVSVPEIGFSDDAETNGDWQANGFQRIDAPVAQQFVVEVLNVTAGSPAQQVKLDASNDATIPLAGSAQGPTKYVIVIAADTQGTTEEAHYSYSLTTSP